MAARREKALTPAHAHSPLARRPYDLRHSGVTLGLNAGVLASFAYAPLARRTRRMPSYGRTGSCPLTGVQRTRSRKCFIPAGGSHTVLHVSLEAERKKSIRRWALWLAVAIPVAAVIIYLLIWYGPDVLARHDIGNVTGQLRVLRQQQARDAARGRLLTLGAGIFAAGALIFTAQNYRVARRTLEVTEQGQVTDRYTKAIEQLGSDKLDVRIGGIYALERVARDSPRDHPTVMEVLAAFIREHSHEQWPLPAPGTEMPERTTRPDVQAAVTVIGRRNSTYDRSFIDLTGADLTGAHLGSADLARADLSGTTSPARSRHARSSPRPTSTLQRSSEPPLAAWTSPRRSSMARRFSTPT